MAETCIISVAHTKQRQIRASACADLVNTLQSVKPDLRCSIIMSLDTPSLKEYFP